MKKNVLLLIFVSVISIVNNVFGQATNFYYCNGTAITWRDDSTSVGIMVSNMSHRDGVEANVRNVFNSPTDTVFADTAAGYIFVMSQNLPSINQNRLISSIEVSRGDVVFFTYSKISNGSRLWLTNNLFFELEDKSYLSTIRSFISGYPTKSLEQIEENEYKLTCDNEHLMMRLSNNLVNQDGVIYATPDFYSRISFTSEDPLFNDQWGIKNTSNNMGDPGYDIKVQEAWNFIDRYALCIDTSIRVAVVDQGVETHPDFIMRDGTTKLLPGYTPNIISGNGSPIGETQNHGQVCAGIIGAAHNDIGINGVAPECRIVPINFQPAMPNMKIIRSWVVSSAIKYAWNDSKSDIINCSWKLFNESDLVYRQIQNAIEKGRDGLGCIVVFASGNESLNRISWPACSNSNILVVGAISPCGERKNLLSCDGENWESQYGDKLDVVAPGVQITTIDRVGLKGYNSGIDTNDYDDLGYTKTQSGTSLAAPFVSGTAALMLSVNPNLTSYQIRSLIEKTAQKVRDVSNENGLYIYQPDDRHPSAHWNEEVGYGLVNAHASVVKAMGYDVDLYTRDSYTDYGIEPMSGINFYNSPDIWIRNYRDDGVQNQKANAGTTNYVYVKIHNRGTTASFGNDIVKLYKKYATPTYGSWPNDWIFAGQTTIPSIPAGGESIVCIPTYFPDSDCEFSLLTRIESDFDDLFSTETENTPYNIKLNNNISIKNVVVSTVINGPGLDFDDFGISGDFGISNPTAARGAFNLGFSTSISENDKPIYEVAEVSVVFGPELQRCWADCKGGTTDLRQLNDSVFLVVGGKAKLYDIEIPASATFKMKVVVNFLTMEFAEKYNYIYEVSQYDSADNLMGTLGIDICRPERVLFSANAGENLIVDRNASYSLNAESIGESAHYRWYDESGTLVADGQNIEAIATEAKTFRLEVIADADGYKDYDTVSVSLTPSKIISISPNPTHNNTITVEYNIIDVSSAMIVVTNISGSDGVTRSYQLGTSTSSKTIDITNYAQGAYSISLVCDGAVVDSKQFLRL